MIITAKDYSGVENPAHKGHPWTHITMHEDGCFDRTVLVRLDPRDDRAVVFANRIVDIMQSSMEDIPLARPDAEIADSGMKGSGGRG